MDKEIKQLLEEAKKARLNAYAPYSEFNVGAALLSENGNVYSGCNVENASYGLTVCAERNAVFEMAKNGDRNIDKLVIISDSEDYISPCGACRQVIAEFSEDKTEVYMFNKSGDYKVVTVKELIPLVFKFKKKR